jgi:hypothetical protein
MRENTISTGIKRSSGSLLHGEIWFKTFFALYIIHWIALSIQFGHEHLKLVKDQANGGKFFASNATASEKKTLEYLCSARKSFRKSVRVIDIEEAFPQPEFVIERHFFLSNHRIRIYHRQPSTSKYWKPDCRTRVDYGVSDETVEWSP